ncbi:AAA family ATPase [Woeseia oceani]|uniref:AAA+ ATPase domain-containing protein n=1 Tax=Woeseia oceani TaxID=1548547 RepID=A0A193LEH1_9GAMM|nr:AAA family ATPase [Woeseia oceani]ANO50851.1 hypothetical protein BA177_06190 [Woeseia oceani]
MSKQLARALGAVSMPRRANIVCGADINPSPIDWRWHGWLAAGKLHILAGAPGTGKTTLALSFAAAITTNGHWPDGSKAPLGNVLVCSYEDDAGDTLVPRLAAMGADLNRVHFLQGITENGEHRAFNAAQDLLLLTKEADRIGNVALIIVDPIVSAMGQVDSHKNLETRQALQPLADFATSTRATVLGITHLAKGTNGRDPLERLLGSVAFGALARVVLGAAKVQDGDGEKRVVARIKSNLGPDEGGFHYDLVQAVAKGIETVSVAWGSPLEGTARELLASEDDCDPTGSRDAMTEAKEFLVSVIGAGVTSAKAIYGEASQAGISKRTLERAKASLNIRSTRTRLDGGWEWCLPTLKVANQQGPTTKNQELNPVDRQDRQSDSLATLATLAEFGCPKCSGEGCDWCCDTGRNPAAL